MRNYFLRRLLQAIPTLFGVTLISFLLMQVAPGDPIKRRFDPNATPETIALLRKQYCLDRSMLAQYRIWLMGDAACRTRGIVRGDFGRSFKTQRPVIDTFMERIPATLELSTAALVMGLVIGLPIGVLSAVKQYSWFDRFGRFFSVIFDAIPEFWFGLILILIFSTTLGWLPVGGRQTIRLPADSSILWDRIVHLIMPASVLAVGWIAVLSRFMRAEMLEVIRTEYVRTAHAKGLPARQVNFSHAARTALIPIATILGPAIAGLIGGTVVVERIFSWPGIGRLTLDALTGQDYPTVMAGVVITSVIVIIGNLLSDLLYVLIDPRIRLQ